MTTPQSREPSLSRQEWNVMNSLWKHCPPGGNITVSELIDRTSREYEWNFSTLKTMMQRLVKKGVLASELRGKTCFYAPLLSRDDLARGSLPGYLEVMLDGAFGPLVAYLAERRKLSAKQRQQLEELLKDKTR